MDPEPPATNIDHEPEPPRPLGPSEFADWRHRGIPELTELLYWRWDPIGVNRAFPSVTDEYRDYATLLVDCLHAGARSQDLAFVLHEIERTWITLPTSDAHRLDVAERIIEWYAESTRIRAWSDDEDREAAPTRRSEARGAAPAPVRQTLRTASSSQERASP